MWENQHAKYVLRAMVDAVFVVGLDDNIALANKAAYRLLEYEPDSLLGVPLTTVFANDASALHSSTKTQLVVENAQLHREEVTLATRTGSLIPASITGAAVLDTSQDLVGIVLVARDLRETKRLVAAANEEIALRRRAEQQLAEAKESVERELDETRHQLLHADRLATLGTLAGGLGHELANVATVFVGCLDRIDELAAEGAFSAGMHRAYGTATRHLVQHTHRLRNLARPGPDYEEPMDLRTIIKDTVSMLHEAGKTKYVNVTTHLPDMPVTCRVNRIRIEQILVNLIGNAVDALDQRPQKRIEIHISEDFERQRARCIVRDTGCGLSAEEQQRVFESFYTTKPIHEGTGLGLAVVQQIVESYAGAISIESTLDVGTSICFDLPIATGRP